MSRSLPEAPISRLCVLSRTPSPALEMYFAPSFRTQRTLARGLRTFGLRTPCARWPRPSHLRLPHPGHAGPRPSRPSTPRARFGFRPSAPSARWPAAFAPSTSAPAARLPAAFARLRAFGLRRRGHVARRGRVGRRAPRLPRVGRPGCRPPPAAARSTAPAAGSCPACRWPAVEHESADGDDRDCRDARADPDLALVGRIDLFAHGEAPRDAIFRDCRRMGAGRGPRVESSKLRQICAKASKVGRRPKPGLAEYSP